jgi:hypothetical protein
VTYAICHFGHDHREHIDREFPTVDQAAEHWGGRAILRRVGDDGRLGKLTADEYRRAHDILAARQTRRGRKGTRAAA